MCIRDRWEVDLTSDDRQYGAFKQRSTTHALVDMLHHWHAAIDKGQSVRTLFVDFAKEFDHVDHNVLVSKMVALGLPDVIVRWICALLRDRRQHVNWRFPVRLATAGGWNATRILPWPTDICHSD